MMMGNILSPTHLLLVLAVALLVLGPKRLPEAGRGIGSAIRGFKEALSMPENRAEPPAIGPAGVPAASSGASQPDGSTPSVPPEPEAQ
jgi:sec-independent protein translocase protein TatA